MKTYLRLPTTLSVFFLFSCHALRAFNVNPMVAELDPNQPRSQQVFVLTNTSEKEKPIEVAVVKPRIDENGAEIMEVGIGEDQFLIVPQQFVLPPNSRRSVKVFYVGDPRQEEETYRLLFKELPVALTDQPNLPEGESAFSMSIVMQYYTRIWLTPAGLKETLTVTDFAKEDVPTPVTQTRPDDASDAHSDDGTPTAPMLRFTVANLGDRHGYLRYPKFNLITRDGKSFTLPDESIQQISGQVVLKRSAKQFRVGWQESFPAIEDITEIRIKTARR